MPMLDMGSTNQEFRHKLPLPATCSGRVDRSGGHGTRTRNPLRGTTFPVWPLANSLTLLNSRYFSSPSFLGNSAVGLCHSLRPVTEILPLPSGERAGVRG